MVWCKAYFDILNPLLRRDFLTSVTDGQTERQTDASFSDGVWPVRPVCRCVVYMDRDGRTDIPIANVALLYYVARPIK